VKAHLMRSGGAVTSWKERDYPACWEWSYTWVLPWLPGETVFEAESRMHSAVSNWQKGRCAICGEIPTATNKTSQTLVWDHDHSSGLFRGYLCWRCNSTEGCSKAEIFHLYRVRHPAKILRVYNGFHGDDLPFSMHGWRVRFRSLCKNWVEEAHTEYIKDRIKRLCESPVTEQLEEFIDLDYGTLSEVGLFRRMER
jgi:hypothetical protein